MSNLLTVIKAQNFNLNLINHDIKLMFSEQKFRIPQGSGIDEIRMELGYREL